MKRLTLIRHAKSSWSDPTVTDFHRKLNKRGKRDAPFMAEKLASTGAAPGCIIASPAKRAKKTAKIMARAVNFDVGEIIYNDAIYSSSIQELYKVLKHIDDSHKEIFFVGHNFAITDLAEELTGESLVNIPTCGIVAMDCRIKSWLHIAPGCAKLRFFDYPKKYQKL